MFKAIQEINKKLNTDIIVCNSEGEIAGNTSKKIEYITDHFKKTILQRQFAEIKPQKLDNPFTINEIKNAIKSLKSNKSSGCDKLRAEHLKYTPSEIKEEIV